MRESVSTYFHSDDAFPFYVQTANSKRDKANPARKFSSFVKKMMIEFDRDPTLYPEGNIIEWPRTSNPNPSSSSASNPQLDGFEVKRQGDQPVQVRLVFYPQQYPEQFKINEPLASILGLKSESRTGAIQAVWNYVKIMGLQDKADRRIIHCDERLSPLFSTPGGGGDVHFHALPELVNRFLAPPDPILIRFSFDPTQAPPEKPTAWDIDIKVEDVGLRAKMTNVVQVQQSKESVAQIQKLDDEISLLAQSLQNSHLKRTFLQSFARDPQLFVQQWLESQSRDLESVLGSGPTEGLTVRQEELKRSEFFRLPWVDEVRAALRQYLLSSHPTDEILMTGYWCAGGYQACRKSSVIQMVQGLDSDRYSFLV